MMKRIMLAFVLAIAAGVWTMSKAACLAQPSQELYGENITVIGAIQMMAFPCEEGYPCVPCLTIAIVTDDKTYYISSTNEHVQAYLDYIFSTSIPAIYPLPLQATITGTPYIQGSFDYLQVNNAADISVEHVPSAIAEKSRLYGYWDVIKVEQTCTFEDGHSEMYVFTDADRPINLSEHWLPTQWEWLIEENYVEYNPRSPFLDVRICHYTLENHGIEYVMDITGYIQRNFRILKLTDTEMEWEYTMQSCYHHEYLRKEMPPLPSLCDEWHMLLPGFCWPYTDITYMHRLANDTLIGNQKYVKLESNQTGDFAYEGAMREGKERDIYFIPNGSTKEFLLYSFHKNIWKGDRMSNVWLGGNPTDYPNGWEVEVEEVLETTPRTIVLKYSVGDNILPVTWIEGVGMTTGPAGWGFLPGQPVDPTPELLCAYKYGQQMYASILAYNYDCCNTKHDTPHDTIPLFIQDGPGSSTVEPVDPNLIYATLTKDILSLYEKMDLEIGFTLYKAPSANQMPAIKRTIKATTFSDSISTVLTESGYYTIELTNPTWDYTIVGTFEYQVPQAVENTVANTPAATKILRDGQLILLYKGKTYNVQGQQIQ